MRRFVLPFSLLVLAACRGEQPPEPVNLALPRVGSSVPYSFESRRSDATIVFFFTTWCVPCQAMEPFVADASRKGRPEGIEVVAIALDTDGRKTVEPYIAATQPPYPVLLGGGVIAQGQSPFGKIPELPAVIFLDRDGRPSSAIAGVANTEMLLDRAREVKDR